MARKLPPDPSESPEMPQIPDVPEELLHPISALTRAAVTLRGVLVQVVEGKPFEEIVEERGDYLLLGEKVIDAWIKKLGIDLNEDEEDWG